MSAAGAMPLQPSYLMRPPKACSVYPTCVFIFWEAPRAVTQVDEVENITGQLRPSLVQWSYVVEWTTNNSPKTEVAEMFTASSHAVLELLYPQETLQVRIVARGSCDGSEITRVSTSCTVEPGLAVALPWLHPRSMRCLCIFDALFFSYSGIHCVDAIPSSWKHVRAKMESVRLLESRFSCAIVKAVYEEPPYPITSTTVYYFVMCPKALVNPRDKLRHCDIKYLLERDQEQKPCAVFCGIGETGSSAALAAHLFISAIPPSSNELCSRVFCIAYGSPRRLLVEDYLVLASSPPFAGNFLHYTALLAPKDPLFEFTGDVLNSDAPVGVSGAAAGGGSPKEVHAVQHFNMPLGLRCGPVFDGTSGNVHLEARCSGVETLGREECNELLDVSTHLSMLNQLILQCYHSGDTGDILVPMINNVQHAMEDGVTVFLTIEGESLHFGPRVICTSSRNQAMAAVSVTAVTPTRLTATFSLMDMLTTKFFARHRRPPQSLLVEISLFTDHGYVSFNEYRIVIAEDISLLLFHSSHSDGPHQWIFGPPGDLVDGAISVEPLLTSLVAGGPNTSTFVPFQSTSLLSDIAAVSELVGKHAVKKPETGLYNFIFRGAAQSTKPISIGSIPMHEAVLLKDALKRHAASETRDPNALRSELDPWKRRLLARLPSLDSGNYREKLLSLLLMLGGPKPAADTTAVALETLLLSKVLHNLRRSQNAIHLNYTNSLSTCMGFDVFYERMLPLALAWVKHSEEAELEALHNIATLWIACLLYHLRGAYLFTHAVVVAGCAGSGCNTLCHAIVRERAARQHHFVGTQRERVIVVRRAKLGSLADVKEALARGLGITAIVCGELSDVAGKEFFELWCSLRRMLCRRMAQRLFAFLSKVDELLGRNQLIKPLEEACIGAEGGAVAFQSLQRQAALAARTEWDVGSEKRGEDASLAGFVAVSFAPSVLLLRNSPFVHSSGMSAEEFAQKLMSISSYQLRRVLAGIVEGEFVNAR